MFLFKISFYFSLKLIGGFFCAETDIRPIDFYFVFFCSNEQNQSSCVDSECYGITEHDRFKLLVLIKNVHHKGIK